MQRRRFFPFLPEDIKDLPIRQKGPTMGRAGRDEIDLGGRPDPIKPTKVTMKGHEWRIEEGRPRFAGGIVAGGVDPGGLKGGDIVAGVADPGGLERGGRPRSTGGIVAGGVDPGGSERGGQGHRPWLQGTRDQPRSPPLATAGIVAGGVDPGGLERGGQGHRPWLQSTRDQPRSATSATAGIVAGGVDPGGLKGGDIVAGGVDPGGSGRIRQGHRPWLQGMMHLDRSSQALAIIFPPVSFGPVESFLGQSFPIFGVLQKVLNLASQLVG
jgi:hypothetical protein